MARKNPPLDLCIIACEPSADLHGRELIDALREKHPGISISAIAGPKMRETDVNVLMPMEKLQVMGFIDIIAAMPKLIRTFFQMRKILLQKNPKACVFIDYPGFNLRMEASLRKKGYQGKLIHYVSPTVWAWAKGRMKGMEENLDHLLTIFPFEKEVFKETSLKVTYVGNPLVSLIKKQKVPQKKRIGIFPGSRKKEIERNLPAQLNAFKKCAGFEGAISLSHEKHRSLIEKILEKEKQTLPILEKSHELMESCAFAIATSGTVTLELALFEVPTVVTFAIRPLDLFIAKNLLKIDLPFYCIVNIIFDDEVFPELFGPNLTPKKLEHHVKKFVESKEKREECKEKLRRVKKLLTEENPRDQAATEILAELGKNPGN